MFSFVGQMRRISVPPALFVVSANVPLLRVACSRESEHIAGTRRVDVRELEAGRRFRQTYATRGVRYDDERCVRRVLVLFVEHCHYLVASGDKLASRFWKGRLEKAFVVGVDAWKVAFSLPHGGQARVQRSSMLAVEFPNTFFRTYHDCFFRVSFGRFDLGQNPVTCLDASQKGRREELYVGRFKSVLGEDRVQESSRFSCLLLSEIAERGVPKSLSGVPPLWV